MRSCNGGEEHEKGNIEKRFLTTLACNGAFRLDAATNRTPKPSFILATDCP